jgi:hypothetical protein
MTVVDQLRGIQARATTLEPSAIDQAVSAVLGSVPVADLRSLQAEFLGAPIARSRVAVARACANKIHDLRAMADRVRQIEEMTK